MDTRDICRDLMATINITLTLCPGHMDRRRLLIKSIHQDTIRTSVVVILAQQPLCLLGSYLPTRGQLPRQDLVTGDLLPYHIPRP